MTIIRQTTYTCDRCDAVVTTPQSALPPQGWRQLRYAEPPMSAEPTAMGDVCAACWADFCRWWEDVERGTQDLEAVPYGQVAEMARR